MIKLARNLRLFSNKDSHKYATFQPGEILQNEKYSNFLSGALYKPFLLYSITRSDAFDNASNGTHLGYSAQFKGTPHFPHGLYGIIVSHNAVIGENCTIFHQVTIGEGKGGAPTIGDNCLIGASTKIIGGITIGNNVKIGAGCVAVYDVPERATVVMQ